MVYQNKKESSQILKDQKIFERASKRNNSRKVKHMTDPNSFFDISYSLREEQCRKSMIILNEIIYFGERLSNEINEYNLNRLFN